MLKRILMAIILSLGVSSLAMADMTDKATLGGQDSSNNYSWRVDVNHNFIPGTTNQNNIGSASNQVNNIYAGSVISNGNIVMAGTANGGSTSMVTTVTAVPLTFALVKKAIAASAAGYQTGTLANGYPGQVLTIQISAVGSSGVWTLTPATSTGWTSVQFNTYNVSAPQLMTLLYVNNTVGWIVLSLDGSTLPTMFDTAGQ